MIRSFSNVRIDSIVGLASKFRLDVKDTALKYGMEEKRLKRFIKTNGFESLSVVTGPYSIGDMCIRCAKELLSSTQTDPLSIDAFIVSSQTHDYFIPGTSYTLQERIGLGHDCLMYDLIQGCPGYVNSLFFAASLIESGVCKKVLVCAGDTTNKSIPSNTDNLEGFLETGDGCSATILSYCEKAPSLDFSLKTYGDKFNVVMEGSFGIRATRVSDDYTRKGFSILGNEMNSFVLDTVKEQILDFFKYKSLNFSDIDKCYSQQTSKTLIQALNIVLGAPENWIPFLASKLGNLSSASIPVFLSENLNYVAKSNDKPILMAGFGVGLGSSLCIADLSNTKILPLILFG